MEAPRSGRGLGRFVEKLDEAVNQGRLVEVLALRETAIHTEFETTAVPAVRVAVGGAADPLVIGWGHGLILSSGRRSTQRHRGR